MNQNLTIVSIHFLGISKTLACQKPQWKPISLGLNSGTSIMRDYYLKEDRQLTKTGTGHITYETAEKTPTDILKLSIVSIPAVPKNPHNRYSHNLTTVTHKVSDHHTSSSLAVTSYHYSPTLYQLLTVGVGVEI
jgi:hypothetical protein